MLLIFFLAFAFIYQLSSTSESSSLNYYDAEAELNVIREWYEMVRIPLDETTSMKQLGNEAWNVTGKPGTRMNEYLHRAISLNKSVSGLTRAECLVVTMYTDDNDARAFYREYNVASTNRIWQPYCIYTTRLMSALGKLAKIEPLPTNATLYRGISFRPETPRARRIFWKAFTSTSLDFQTANYFAGPYGTILVFQPPASRHAAQIWKLSKFSMEKEVILLPFEAFDFWYANDRELYFNISETQELLPSVAPLFRSAILLILSLLFLRSLVGQCG